jgi:hypothetical protein
MRRIMQECRDLVSLKQVYWTSYRLSNLKVLSQNRPQVRPQLWRTYVAIHPSHMLSPGCEGYPVEAQDDDQRPPEHHGHHPDVASRARVSYEGEGSAISAAHGLSATLWQDHFVFAFSYCHPLLTSKYLPQCN